MSTYQKKGRKSTIMDVSKNLKYILKVWEHFKIEKFKAYIISEEQEKKKIAENRTSTPAWDSTENLEFFYAK